MLRTIFFDTFKEAKNRDDTENRHRAWNADPGMPVKELFSSTELFSKTAGGFLRLYDRQSSYDLSDLSLGMAICFNSALFYWENDTDGDQIIDVDCYHEVEDPDGTIIVATTFPVYSYLKPGYWYAYQTVFLLQNRPWRIYKDGTYTARAWAEEFGQGGGGMAEGFEEIEFNNVPDPLKGDTDKAGYIWVEGEDLAFIGALGFKHVLKGKKESGLGTTPDKAGYIWLDESQNNVTWIGESGNYYETKWKVKQFECSFGGASGEQYAGTDKAGHTWMDDEFGRTHFSYIGTDGYKYLVGSGDNPYT